MFAIDRRVPNRREALVGDLTDVAFEALALHGVGGTSVDLELRVWKRLEDAVGRLCSGVNDGPEDRLALLTQAAYEVALEQGFATPFVDLEMELWKGLRRVARRNRIMPARPASSTCVLERDVEAEGMLEAVCRA